MILSQKINVYQFYWVYTYTYIMINYPPFNHQIYTFNQINVLLVAQAVAGETSIINTTIMLRLINESGGVPKIDFFLMRKWKWMRAVKMNSEWLFAHFLSFCLQYAVGTILRIFENTWNDVFYMHDTHSTQGISKCKHRVNSHSIQIP